MSESSFKLVTKKAEMIKRLLAFFILTGIFCPNFGGITACAAPLTFTEIQPEILSAEGMRDVLSFLKDFREEKWQSGAKIFEKTLTLSPAKLVPAGFSEENADFSVKNAGDYVPVSEFCQSVLNAHAGAMPGEIFERLREKCVKFGLPASEENPPEAAPPEKTPPAFRLTPTQVFAPDGKLLYSDPLPEAAQAGPVPHFYEPGSQTLYARMGTPVTFWPERERDARPQGYVAALDMAAEGRLRWLRRPESPEWAFAGAVVADGTRVYIPLVRQTVPPEFHLAALDARTGEWLWRRFLFTAIPADSPENVWRTPAVFTLPLCFSHGALEVGNTATGVTVFLEKSAGKIRKLTIHAVPE